MAKISGSSNRVLQAKDFGAIGKIANSLLDQVCKTVDPPQKHTCDVNNGGCKQLCIKKGKNAVCQCQVRSWLIRMLAKYFFHSFKILPVISEPYIIINTQTILNVF